MRVKTKNNGRLEESICKQFVYLSDLGVYLNSSDMNELGVIGRCGFEERLKKRKLLQSYR